MSSFNYKFKSFFLIILFCFLVVVFYFKELIDYGFPLTIICTAAVATWFGRAGWTKGKYTDDQVLTFLALASTVLFFILQNLQTIKDTNDAIRSTNKFNCSVAKELINEITETQKSKNLSHRIKSRYSTELYKTNLDYLIKKFDNKETEIIFQAINDMDASNRFLDLSLINANDFPKNLLSSDGKTDISVIFDAYASIGKIYDEKILGLTARVKFGLNKMDSVLSAYVSNICTDHEFR